MNIVQDVENGLYIVMKDGIDINIFYSLEEAENFISNAN